MEHDKPYKDDYLVMEEIKDRSGKVLNLKALASVDTIEEARGLKDSYIHSFINVGIYKRTLSRVD